MLPIPSHLESIFHPVGDENNQFKAKGDIICTCGSRDFELDYVADVIGGVVKLIEIEGRFFLIVNGRCQNCKKHYQFLDKDFHGWNGFVSNGFGNQSFPRPIAHKWHCKQCDHSIHQLQIVIFSKGKEDFIIETENSMDEKDWPDAFSWMIIEPRCGNCGYVEREWISYETM